MGRIGPMGARMTAYLLPFKEVLSDVKLVGKQRGYLFFARRQSLFVVPMQEEELADIADELTARGMEDVLGPLEGGPRPPSQRSPNWCKQLLEVPIAASCDRLITGLPWNMQQLFAVDPLVIRASSSVIASAYTAIHRLRKRLWTSCGVSGSRRRTPSEDDHDGILPAWAVRPQRWLIADQGLRTVAVRCAVF